LLRASRDPLLGAGAALAQARLNGIPTGANTAVGAKASTKLCDVPPAMSTGVFAGPVSTLVCGLVRFVGRYVVSVASPYNRVLERLRSGHRMAREFTITR
jgi:hypothetical protein